MAHPACGPAGPASNRDAALATVLADTSMSDDPLKAAEAVEKYVAGDFVQHSPTIAQGKAALMEHERGRARSRLEAGGESRIARILADGDLVLTHRRVTTTEDPRGVAHADLYRVRGGRIVEHWGVVQPIPAFSVAGHSMVAGPLEPGRTIGGPPGSAP